MARLGFELGSGDSQVGREPSLGRQTQDIQDHTRKLDFLDLDQVLERALFDRHRVTHDAHLKFSVLCDDVYRPARPKDRKGLFGGFDPEPVRRVVPLGKRRGDGDVLDVHRGHANTVVESCLERDVTFLEDARPASAPL